MTVAAKPPIETYLEDGSTVTFPVPFRFDAKTDLVVERLLPDSSIQPLSLGIDYSAAGGQTDAGGSITRTVATNGARLRIQRRTARAQAMVYTTGDRFPAGSHETALDRNVMIVQEQDVAIDDTATRALMVPVGELALDLPLAAVRAGSALVFDEEGQPLAKPIGSFPAGPTGTSNNTRATLADIQNAAITDGTSLYDNGLYTWTPGDFLGQTDDISIIASNKASAMQGAWKRSTPGQVEMRLFYRDGDTSDQPMMQRAFDAAKALGIKTVLSDRKFYFVRTPVRMAPVDEFHNNTSGMAIVIDSQIEWVSTCGGSYTQFLSPNGGSLETEWQLVDGTVWRGPGVFLRGHLEDPGREMRNSITLRSIHLRGGTIKTGNSSFPANPSTGDGWDVTHKGVWADNDTYTGDIALYDSSIIGFKGELHYQGGIHHGGLIMRNVELGMSNSNAINPNDAEFVDIDGLYVHDVHQCWEGWSGKRGRLVNARFENCDRGGGRFQGGVQNRTGSGWFYAPTRYDPAILPNLELGVTLVDAGLIATGAFVTGVVNLVDSTLYIYSDPGGVDWAQDIYLIVNATADQKSLPAVQLFSGPNSAASHRNIKLIINTFQTDAALTAGRAVTRPVEGLGFYGPNIEISGGSGPVAALPRQAGGGIIGTMPVVRNNSWSLTTGAEDSAQQLWITGDSTIAPTMGYVFLGGTPGPHEISLQTAGYPRGAQVVVYVAPDGGLQAKFTSGVGNKRLRAASYTLSGGKHIVFEFNGTFWDEVRVDNYV